MKVTERTIKFLGKTLCGDNGILPYKNGPQLVDFFVEFGADDQYGEGFPSRWKYTEDKLRQFNGSQELKSIIEYSIDTRDLMEAGYDPDKIDQGDLMEQLRMLTVWQRGLWNTSGLNHYIYDADGQRLMKSTLPMAHSSVDAQQLQATNSFPSAQYTVYVNAGLVYESDGGPATYTKHYYAGPLRVASHIGSGNPNQETHPTSGGNLAQGGPAGSTGSSNGLAVLGDLNGLLANYGMSVPPTALPTDTIAMQVLNDPGECDAYYGADVIEKNRCLCDHFPDVALQQGIDCSPYTPIYWYHPDYIGNVEFVSDRTGQPYQHFYYAPFGDPMVSQHAGTGSFNSAFRFNAKEYDEETGNYYYGARYYEPKSSVWMGVDALATKYPGMNPYNFVMGNPIMAMDPDGNESDICETCPEDAKYDRFRNNLRLKWDYDAESGGLIRDHSYVPPFDFGDGYETMAPSHSISEAKKPLATKYKESIVGGSNVSKYLIYPTVESVYIAAQSLVTPDPRNLEGYFVSPKEKLDAGINASLVASPAVKSIGLLDDAARGASKVKYIGRLEDLKGIPRSQTLLDDLPNLGSPKANYYQNMSVLRKAIRDGYTIKDASFFRPNSQLAPTLLNPNRTVGQTFLGAERLLLKNRGLWP